MQGGSHPYTPIHPHCSYLLVLFMLRTVWLLWSVLLTCSLGWFRSSYLKTGQQTITFPTGANVRTVTSPALIFVVFVHSDIVESFLDTMHKTGGARPCFAFKFLLILLYLLTLGCDFTNGFLCLAEMKVTVHYIVL